MQYTIVAGTTTPLRFQLLEAGSAIDLLDCDVELLLSDRTGTTVDTPGTVTITDDAEGKIALDPTDADVFDPELGPYAARWKVTDSNGDIFYVPTGPRDVWNIIGA